MQIITKNIRWRASWRPTRLPMFDRSPNNLSWDIVLMDRWPEQKNKEKQKNKKSKNNRSAFACRSKKLTIINGCRLMSPYRHGTRLIQYGTRLILSQIHMPGLQNPVTVHLSQCRLALSESQVKQVVNADGPLFRLFHCKSKYAVHTCKAYHAPRNTSALRLSSYDPFLGYAVTA